jgi:hypothetical protein
MPNTDSSHADPNPHGDPMNETQTSQTVASPTTGGPMTETAMPAADPQPIGEHVPPDPQPDPTPDDEPIPDTVRMITYEDAARASLRASIVALGIDEVRVLQRIADRLQDGQRQYGFFRLASDARAFRATEARQEIEDALVYFACAWLVGATKEVA